MRIQMENQESLSGRSIIIVTLVVALILIPMARQLGHERQNGSLVEAGRYHALAQSRQNAINAEAHRNLPERVHQKLKAPLRTLAPGGALTVRATYHSTDRGPLLGNKWFVGQALGSNTVETGGWFITWPPFARGDYPAFVTVDLQTSGTALPGPYSLLIRSTPDISGSVDYYQYDFKIARPTPKKPAR